MKIAHFYPFLGRDKGGIAACLPPMLDALQRQNLTCLWVSQRFRGESENAAPGESAPDDAAFAMRRAATCDGSGFGFSPALSALARGSGAEVFHSHGLWMWSDWVASRAARAAGAPHVISPHGMLEPWALANSARKKRAMWRAFQGRALRNARVLHALCAAERDTMRALGLRNPIAVVPNGVNLSEFAALCAPDARLPDAFEAQFPRARGRKVLLFMARLHPKKGLVPLLHAWKAVAPDFPDWLLVIAGPDEGGHRAHLETIVAQGGLQESVTFTAMLDGALKRAALARADAFVLPSFSEGFSIALLEAMACALPTLLTPECHFPDAVSCGAAIEAEPNPDALSAGLRQLCGQSAPERAAMGARARELVAQNYTWERVARQWAQLYQWCARGGSPPSFVDESSE